MSQKLKVIVEDSGRLLRAEVDPLLASGYTLINCQWSGGEFIAFLTSPYEDELQGEEVIL